MAFGETLTFLRKSRGMSQEQLAEQLNLTRQTISKWELDQSTPDLEYIVQLSELFGVTTDYLIKGQECCETSSSKLDHREEKAPAKAYTWCFFGGLTLVINPLLGMIALVICSAFKPWTVTINRHSFDGFVGFLLGTHTMWLFIALAILCTVGIFFCAFGILKNIAYYKKRG